MADALKFIYFGSSQFSKDILMGLYLKGYEPCLVVSKPDMPKGRHLHLEPTKVSSFAHNSKIPLIRPKSLKDRTVKQDLKEEEAQLFIVADYGEIIPESILKMPKIFSVCVHPSLLPLYRGASPIEAALRDGRNETGVTIFKINREVDAGDIILQKNVPIYYEDDFFSLRKRLAKEGVSSLVEAIKKILASNYTLTLQDSSKASLTHKLTKEDGLISWDSPAEQIRNLIRATLGWPSAYTYYKGQMIKILSGEVIEESFEAAPGMILSTGKEGIAVATAKGILRIRKLKPEGKPEMDAWSFVCGHKIGIGAKLTSTK